MATLFITEQGSLIRKTSDRLIVQKDDAVLLEIPCLKIETVLLYGNVQVTTQALAEMLDHGIELALLSRSGRRGLRHIESEGSRAGRDAGAPRGATPEG
jgi:CRISPR-associated protein Cas1